MKWEIIFLKLTVLEGALTCEEMSNKATAQASCAFVPVIWIWTSRWRVWLDGYGWLVGHR